MSVYGRALIVLGMLLGASPEAMHVLHSINADFGKALNTFETEYILGDQTLNFR
jgi:hypothetical protein